MQRFLATTLFSICILLSLVENKSVILKNDGNIIGVNASVSTTENDISTEEASSTTSFEEKSEEKTEERTTTTTEGNYALVNGKRKDKKINFEHTKENLLPDNNLKTKFIDSHENKTLSHKVPKERFEEKEGFSQYQEILEIAKSTEEKVEATTKQFYDANGITSIYLNESLINSQNSLEGILVSEKTTEQFENATEEFVNATEEFENATEQFEINTEQFEEITTQFEQITTQFEEATKFEDFPEVFSTESSTYSSQTKEVEASELFEDFTSSTYNPYDIVFEETESSTDSLETLSENPEIENFDENFTKIPFTFEDINSSGYYEASTIETFIETTSQSVQLDGHTDSKELDIETSNLLENSQTTLKAEETAQTTDTTTETFEPTTDEPLWESSCVKCTKLSSPIKSSHFNETTKVFTIEIQTYREKYCQINYFNVSIRNFFEKFFVTENSIEIPLWDKCQNYNVSLTALNACNESITHFVTFYKASSSSCTFTELYTPEGSLSGWECFAIVFSILIALFISLTAVYVYWKQRNLQKNVPEVVPENEALIPHVVPIKEFPQHYNKCKEKVYILKNEFSTLSKVGEHFETTHALLPTNKKKNRYVNILPYDHTRVTIKDSDYINASFIKGYSEDVEYIATQGPLESTLADFWRMVVQERVLVIAMVAQFEEHNRNKCFRYIPGNKELMFISDDLQIKCAYELNYDFYVERQIVVQSSQEQLTIVHLQYLNWPDFGCPNGTENMLAFAQIFRQSVEVNFGKALVHCSAGVGRTGTLIAVDILLQTIRDGGDIDIYTVVANLRAQRVKMVQAEEQYLYIYRCVNDFILNPPKLREIKAVDAIYENVNNIIELQDLVTSKSKNDSNENVSKL